MSSLSQSPQSPLTLLIFNPMAEELLDQIRTHAHVVYAPTAELRARAVAAHGADAQAVLTIGSIGLTAEEVAQMPRLRLACTLGAGYEGLALDALRARGIVLATGAGTNDTSVADHSFGLILASMRNFRTLDLQAREGVDRYSLPHPPSVSGKKLGILGLGHIGLKIARRAEGFDMPVGYHNRQPKAGVPHSYFDSLKALATWADVLVCATPGGAGTKHLVNAEILQALGPNGYLINIARGSVVDTVALAAALKDGTIAGAGIDVYESEPHRPELLIDLPNILITPHVAGWSPEATQASLAQFIGNLTGVFSGRGAVAPVDLGS